MTPAQQRVVLTRPTDVGVGGSGLLTGMLVQNQEFNGAGFDFTYRDVNEQVRIKDTVTLANNYRGPAQGKLTYTSPSAKNTRRSDGIWAATNGTTDLPYEWDSNGAPLGLRVEEARTNLCLQSSTLTNASWTKVSMTTAKTATGPNGTANYATTCTASAGNATALQAITSTSASRITSMFIKRRTGSGTINITQDNGTTWTVVTVTTSWTQVQSTNQTTANPTVGLRIVTSGDAVDVAWFQHELGVFATTPIETTTVSVARNADAITMATTSLPYSQTVGTLISHARTPIPTSDTTRRTVELYGASGEQTIINRSTSTNIMVLSVNDGGVNQAAVGGTASSANIDSKTAGAWAANDFSSSTDGTAVAVDTAGTLPTNTTLGFGQSFTAAREWNGWIRQITYIARRLADAELIAVTRA